METKKYIITAFNYTYGVNEVLPGAFRSKKQAIEYAKRLRSSGLEKVRVINFVNHSIID